MANNRRFMTARVPLHIARPSVEPISDEEYGPAFDSEEEAILSHLLAEVATIDPHASAKSVSSTVGSRLREASSIQDGSTDAEGVRDAFGYGTATYTGHEPGPAPEPGADCHGNKSSRWLAVAYEDDCPQSPNQGSDMLLDDGGKIAPEAFAAPSSVPIDRTATDQRREQPHESGELDEQQPATSHISSNVAAADHHGSEHTKNFVHNSGSISDPSVLETSDTRTPLERFRPSPRGLSVTDLVSPAWCELKFARNLARYGRTPKTAAMRLGTHVHEQLEAEVHINVSVEVQTREDSFGLQIWNSLQGLKTLRSNGITREFNVWGVLHGQSVRGVVDELSYERPELTEEAPQYEPKNQAKQRRDNFTGPAPRGRRRNSALSSVRLPRPQQQEGKTIYICDVKTRGARSLPHGATFRSTAMQLQLYRYMLSEMVAGHFDSSDLAQGFHLDLDAPFSDVFIAQISGLGQSPAGDSSVTSPGALPDNDEDDALNVLLEHNSLRRLWQRLQMELALTFPRGVDSLGDVLKAEYRNPVDGTVRGHKTVIYDETAVSAWVKNVLQWWLGERAPEGVVLEEAFKCHSCEFADDCQWRIDRADEARERYRRNRMEANPV